jgi:WD40 repeat protein
VWRIKAKGARELWSLSAQETSSGIVGVAFSPHGTRVMAGDAGISAVKIWDLGSNGDAEWANLPTPGHPTAEFMPDGLRVVAGSWNNGQVVTMWDLQTRRYIRTIGRATDDACAKPHCFYIQSIEVSPSGGSIAVGGDGAYCPPCGGEVARVWDTSTGDELYRVWHRYDISHVDFSSDGEYLVTASWYGTAKVIDQSGRVLRVLQEDRGFNLFDARFSPDGDLVATAAVFGLGELGRGRVRIWDWARDDVVRTIRSDARFLDFDPRGMRIAMAGPEGRAEIWDVETGTRVAVLAGPSGGSADIAFSPDGSRVATASADGTVRLFEADTGAQQLVLRGSGCAVEGVAFSPDGTKLASTSWCDGVRVWALDIDDLLEIARREVMRPLTDEECRQYLHVDRCLQA